MRTPWFVAVAAATLCMATAAAAAPSAEALALARRYAAAIHMENQMGAVMNSMMPIMMDRAAQARGTTITGELKEAVARAAAESARAITPKMIDIMVPIVAETFTVEELRAAVGYYESPLGQSLMAKAPAFTAAATPALAKLMPEMEADMAARICKEIGCEAPAK